MAKVLRVGILAPVRTLDAREARETVSSSAASQVYESACRARAEGKPESLLLEAPVAEGPLTWSAGVKPGIEFSDGTPLTAAVVASSLERAQLIRAVAKVEARGDRVNFQLMAPNPRFDLLLTLHQSAISLQKGTSLLGTGPFMPGPGSTLENLRLVRNPRHRNKVAIDEIVFSVYPPAADGRPQALLDAITRGEVDFTSMLSRTDAGTVSGMRKIFQPANSTAILFFNVDRPALQTPAVRRALAMGLDRMGVAQLSYTNALAFVASGLLPPLMGAFRDEIPYDPPRAKRELDANPQRPVRLNLMTVWSPRPYLPNPRPVADLIAKQLAALGVEINITTPATSDDFYRSCVRGDYDLLLGGWIGDTPDPADFLEAVLRSDRVQTQASSSVPCANRARLRSPEMDAALAAFRADPSAANRGAIADLLGKLVPVLPLMYGPIVAVASWKLKGVEVSAIGIPDFSAADLDP